MENKHKTRDWLSSTQHLCLVDLYARCFCLPSMTRNSVFGGSLSNIEPIYGLLLLSYPMMIGVSV